MSHVFPRSMRSLPPVIESGEGCYLTDTTGKRYLDMCGGAAVSCLGHGDSEVLGRIKAQLDEIAFAHTGFFTSKPAEALADKLIQYAPAGIERVYFVSGGSEAVESALKLARQYFLEKGEKQRRYFVARRQSYHGNTLGALATGGNAWRREPFAPLLMETHHIAPCYAYRDQMSDESPEEYGLRAANELQAKVDELGGENIIAFVAEPVVGATAGAVPAVPGYFKRIREICDQHGILLILDEIMCGMGRTGTLFACEQDGISPDIVTIAKGLGAGYQPIGAMLCSGEIYRVIENGSGLFQHGHTYLGHPTACAAGLAVMDALIGRNLVPRVAEYGEKVRDALTARFGDHPHVGDIRGRGLFLGVELVSDRETKATFDPGRKVHALIKREAFNNGLMVYPMGGTIDGQHGDHILLAPPFIIEQHHIDEMVDKLALAINRATGLS